MIDEERRMCVPGGRTSGERAWQWMAVSSRTDRGKVCCLKEGWKVMEGTDTQPRASLSDRSGLIGSHRQTAREAHTGPAQVSKKGTVPIPAHLFPGP